MSSAVERENLLPNITELPLEIQQQLRKFAQIAKTAVEGRDEALRRLQGLENLSRMLQEYQAENVRSQDQFKWYEIVLLRTEADLLRTKKKLQEKEAENDQLHQKFERLVVKGHLPKDLAPPSSVVIDRSDGKSEKQEVAAEDETDQKPLSRASRQKRQFLAPVFVGISEDIHNKTLQELEETRRQLKEKVEEDDMSYKDYLDARKSELQIRKLQETLQNRTDEIDGKNKELEKAKMQDKDKIIKDLTEKNEKHFQNDALKVKVIESSNRRCQELKEEIEEMRQKYQQQKESQETGDRHQGRVPDPYQRDTPIDETIQVRFQRISNEKQSLLKMVEELRLREEQMQLENGRIHSEIDKLKRQYDALQDSLKAEEAQYGDEVATRRGCKRCNALVDQLRQIQEVTTILENEKSATVAQMKLFEDDFHKVREQLKFNEEKHQREMSDSMKNCQMLSQELDRSKDNIQKVSDRNQALEYERSQLSYFHEQMTADHRPFYSVDSHPGARVSAGPVHNPGAMPWQEGYMVTSGGGRRQAVDFADGRHEVEADGAFQELKGEESEEEAELTRR